MSVNLVPDYNLKTVMWKGRVISLFVLVCALQTEVKALVNGKHPENGKQSLQLGFDPVRYAYTHCGFFWELPVSAILEAPLSLKMKPWLKGKSLHSNCIFWYVSAVLETLPSQCSGHTAAPKCLLQPWWLIQRSQFPRFQTLLMSLESPLGQWPPTQSSSQMKIKCILKRFCHWKVNSRPRGFLEMCFIPVPLVACLLSLLRTLKFRPKKEHSVPRKLRKLGNADCWYM